MAEETLDTDLDSQLRGLFREAESAIENRAAAKTPESAKTADVAKTPEAARPPESAPVADKSASLSLVQLIRPVVKGLEAVSRATNENTALLKKLDTATANAAAANAASAAAANAATASAAAAAPSAAAPPDLAQIVADLRGMIESKTGVNQSMFSALHQELKGYKDGFLLESVHRPIIRDLISLYDDITGIQRQVTATISDPDSNSESPLAIRMSERLRTIQTNLEHNLEFIAEVLNRLEVTLMDPHGGKLDKRSQRAVAVEFAEDPDREGDVVRVVKRGFLWKDRILRAEEVVIKKWQEGYLVALQASQSK